MRAPGGEAESRSSTVEVAGARVAAVAMDIAGVAASTFGSAFRSEIPIAVNSAAPARSAAARTRRARRGRARWLNVVGTLIASCVGPGGVFELRGGGHHGTTSSSSPGSEAEVVGCSMMGTGIAAPWGARSSSRSCSSMTVLILARSAWKWADTSLPSARCSRGLPVASRYASMSAWKSAAVA